MKKSMLFAVTLAAAVFTGCQKDTPGGENSPETTGNEISFRALTDKTQTRATLVDGNNINSFTVGAIWNDPDAAVPTTFNYMDNINVTRGINGSSTWTYNPIKYWPKKGTVDFYAFSPAGSVNVEMFNTRGGSGGIMRYKVPLNSSGTKKPEDLLVARALGQTGGQVALTFEHALSLVTFSAKNVTTAAKYNITGLELSGLMSIVDIQLSDPVKSVKILGWVGTSIDIYSAGLPEAGATVLPGGPTAEFIGLLGPNEGMMVAPQDQKPGSGVDEDDVNDGTTGTGTPDGIPDDFLVAANNYLVVTYGVTDQVGGEILPAGTKAYFPLDLNFEIGQAYDFQITLGDNLNPVSFTVDVNPWPVANDQPIPQP